MKKFLIRSIIILSILITAGCQALVPDVKAPEPQLADWPTQAWQTSTPEQQGMDSGKLADMFAAIQQQQLRLHSLLIVRNGYLVTEAYFDPYTADVRHTVESNTKSVIAALIGIAIDQGKIKSADEKMADFFPGRFMQNMDARKEAITLQDLLSMTPGLDCADGSPAASGMYQTKLWVQYLQDLPMTDAPGNKWIYCSGASHLLSAVLQEATGVDARSYANQYLFQPLGIAPVEVKDWGTDPEKISNGIAGLYLTPRELAKLGYLYLNRGSWAGKQVVSAAWMDAATREQAYIGPDPYVGGQDRRFGYMFSVFPQQKYYGYLGMAGQELFVLPEQNMVVVFTSSLPVGKEGDLLRFLNDYILPAAQSSQPLPASQAAYDRLASAIQAATGQRQAVPPLPQTALDISGKTYVFDQNPLGWKSIVFSFEPGSGEAVWKLDNQVDLRVGLDGLYRLTNVPDQKPVGVKAAWQNSQELIIYDLNLGEYSETVLTAAFQGDEVTISARSINFGEDPLTIHGSTQK
jgi:CubicO group peptidase (beta-lactamase class C family)